MISDAAVRCPRPEDLSDSADAASEPRETAGEDTGSIEISLLLEAMQRRWGYDFTHYSRASLRRRLDHARKSAGLAHLGDLLSPILHDPGFFDRLLCFLSVTVTEMFRDPPCYRAIRDSLVPVFKTYPFIKIWCAGCATGEEVYSLAILLHEEGYLDRTRLYATDFNKIALATAEKGIYPERLMPLYAANHRQSGGTGAFSDYYTSSYGFARMKGFLRDRITFSYHNLVTDGVFGEMNLISCRNVLIYFDKTLQERVFGLFASALRHGGYLWLGTKESLMFSAVAPLYDAVDSRQKIYRKRA